MVEFAGSLMPFDNDAITQVDLALVMEASIEDTEGGELNGTAPDELDVLAWAGATATEELDAEPEAQSVLEVVTLLTETEFLLVFALYI